MLSECPLFEVIKLYKVVPVLKDILFGSGDKSNKKGTNIRQTTISTKAEV